MMTCEDMEEFAQWQHDEALAVSTDDTMPTEADVERAEIAALTDCLNGQHTLRFTIVNGSLTTVCEDGCS